MNSHRKPKIRPEIEDATIVVSATTTHTADAMKNSPAVVSVISGPSQWVGRVWTLTKDQVLGRDKSKADICIPDTSLSRTHIRFLYSEKGIQVQDLGSTNSSYLNNKTLTANKSYHLQTGDLLKCGRLIFKFVASGNIEAQSLLRVRDRIYTDDLCQINNRKYMETKGQELFLFCKNNSLNVSFLMLDIDHFKNINDQYGHTTGDRILKDITALLQNTIRHSDIFCRMGGEEFAFLLDGKADFTIAFAEKIRQLVEEHSFTFNHQDIPVTISVGVTHLQKEDTTWNDLYKRADQALYRSKNAGRNKVSIQ